MPAKCDRSETATRLGGSESEQFSRSSAAEEARPIDSNDSQADRPTDLRFESDWKSTVLNLPVSKHSTSRPHVCQRLDAGR
jgi:hypothetical protein